MPSGVYKNRPAPDEGMVERSLNEGSIRIAPDKEELKNYIKKRLAEGNMSTYLLAKNTGKQRGAIYSQLFKDGSISYDYLERLLWIVDGDNCPYRYRGTDEGAGGMEPSDFIIKHPNAFVVDYLQDEWKVMHDGNVYVYNKIDWSLKAALKDLDSKI